MTFDYDKCRDLLHRALIGSLESAGERVRALAAAERAPHKWEDVCGIDGVCNDVLPWHRMVGLSFRIFEDERNEPRYRYSPADWKHYEFLGGESTFDEAREYTHRVYEAAGDHRKEVMHLVSLAAADALLDRGVAKRLQSFGISAPEVLDELPRGWFEYMVIDEDRVIKANYCEILIANRVARRLLGRAV
jgi:hypothetical protein